MRYVYVRVFIAAIRSDAAGKNSPSTCQLCLSPTVSLSVHWYDGPRSNLATPLCCWLHLRILRIKSAIRHGPPVDTRSPAGRSLSVSLRFHATSEQWVVAAFTRTGVGVVFLLSTCTQLALNSGNYRDAGQAGTRSRMSRHDFTAELSAIGSRRPAPTSPSAVQFGWIVLIRLDIDTCYNTVVSRKI